MNLDITESDDDGPPELVMSGDDTVTFPKGHGEALPPRKVPITIVTGKDNSNSSETPLAASVWQHHIPTAILIPRYLGYLGAGKTTLLNYILSEQHGKKIAVILNGLYFPSPPRPASPILTMMLIQNSVIQPILRNPSPSIRTASKSKNGSP
jgi:CobW/HypB/UreG, nucleotide-binding domain